MDHSNDASQLFSLVYKENHENDIEEIKNKIFKLKITEIIEF